MNEKAKCKSSSHLVPTSKTLIFKENVASFQKVFPSSKKVLNPYPEHFQPKLREEIQNSDLAHFLPEEARVKRFRYN